MHLCIYPCYIPTLVLHTYPYIEGTHIRCIPHAIHNPPLDVMYIPLWYIRGGLLQGPRYCHPFTRPMTTIPTTSTPIISTGSQLRLSQRFTSHNTEHSQCDEQYADHSSNMDKQHGIHPLITRPYSA
jgi:hypothetical protein